MGAHKGNPHAFGTNATVAMVAKDRYERELYEGDEVLLPALEMKSPTFVIHAIKPNMHPGAQPGTMLVQVTCHVMINVLANKPSPNILRIRMAEEIREQLAAAAPGEPGKNGHTPAITEN